MLSALQSHLASIYCVDPGYDVADFLITDPKLARVLAGESLIADTDESVLLQQDDDGLALSVFLSEDLLERLRDCDPISRLRSDQLADLWVVLEGISHFNYIAWCAGRNRNISLLELEMQAEVDKFVCALLLALSQGETEMAQNMHGWLFDDVTFNRALTKSQRQRYSLASNYAARYCHGLQSRLAKHRERELGELRKFYRLTKNDKISQIHSQTFSV